MSYDSAEVLPRDVVEAMARIVGPASASARALAEADKHSGPVTFLRTRGTILVLIPMATEAQNGGER